jgi:hypothetical protein
LHFESHRIDSRAAGALSKLDDDRDGFTGSERAIAGKQGWFKL